MEKTSDLVDVLESGNIYTIFRMNDFGMFSRLVIKLDSAEKTRYAQYDDAAALVFQIKQKRFTKNKYKEFLYSRKCFAVYDGELEQPIDYFNKITENNGVVVSQAKYRSCDKRYVTDAIEALKEKGIEPVFSQIG